MQKQLIFAPNVVLLGSSSFKKMRHFGLVFNRTRNNNRTAHYK